jgi:hypothetical protein
MVSVPVRGVVLEFSLALKVTLPLPLPEAPAVTVNQSGSLLTAVQEQPARAVTLVEPVPPAVTTDRLVGEIEYSQPRPA